MKPSPLPPELPDPFAVSTARELGVPRSRLRGTSLRAPFHGVRTTRAITADGLEASVRRRAIEFSARMRPDEFYYLVTAAVLWGAPLPPRAFRAVGDTGTMRERPLDVAVILPARASRARGVTGRSVVPALVSVRFAPDTGLRVTSPATTWAMMGGILGRDDLIALGDAFVREPMRPGDRHPLATIEELAAALDAGRRRGAGALRAALPFIRSRSRSRPETQTRLVLLDAGLPEPELNWPVVVGGKVVALIDLAHPDLLVGFEYEGEHHLIDPQQWARDIRRYEMLAALGWRIVRVTKSDLAGHRAAFAARAGTAYATARSK